MKKILIVLLVLMTLVGCGAKDDLALGKYDDKKYVNENFKLEFLIPEGFSHLTADELKAFNDAATAKSEYPEIAKYRNQILNVQHLDGTKMTAYVNAEPNIDKNMVAEANAYLDFLTSNDIRYEASRSSAMINGVEYLQVDLMLQFSKRQRNLITVRNNKLVNVQINYDIANEETAKKLLSLYE